MRARRALELEPIGLGPRQRALVRQHDALLEARQANAADEAAPRRRLALRREGLMVAIERRLDVARQDPFAQPLVQIARGVRVFLVARAFGQDEPHAIVRIERRQFRALLVADDVVGRRQKLVRRARLLGVEDAAKRRDLGHYFCSWARTLASAASTLSRICLRLSLSFCASVLSASARIAAASSAALCAPPMATVAT